jgi:hypothetical protein
MSIINYVFGTVATSLVTSLESLETHCDASEPTRRFHPRGHAHYKVACDREIIKILYDFGGQHRKRPRGKVTRSNVWCYSSIIYFLFIMSLQRYRTPVIVTMIAASYTEENSCRWWRRYMYGDGMDSCKVCQHPSKFADRLLRLKEREQER